jgi:hypothetical protein
MKCFLICQRNRETYRLPMHKVVVAQWLKQAMIEECGDHNVDVVSNSVDHSQFFAPIRGKKSRPTVGLLDYFTLPRRLKEWIYRWRLYE